MAQKLRCVAVDDDTINIELLSDIFKHSPYAEITDRFTSPKKFLQALPLLDFDVCLLDLGMSEMDGLLVARQLNGRPVIFVTGKDLIHKDALSMSPIDIITKPILQYRFNNAFQKAHKILSTDKIVTTPKEFHAFCIEGENDKVKLKLDDVLFVQTEEKAPRNKYLFMRNGKKHKVMDYTLEDILKLCPNMVKINRSELVAIEVVQKYGYDTITLESNSINGLTKHLTLSRMFRKEFIKRMSAL